MNSPKVEDVFIYEELGNITNIKIINVEDKGSTYLLNWQFLSENLPQKREWHVNKDYFHRFYFLASPVLKEIYEN